MLTEPPTIEVTVPDLGEPRASARLTEWLVDPGATVDEGDALCRISIAGGVFEIGSSVAGTLAARRAGPGDPVRAGDLLALVQPAASQAHIGRPVRASDEVAVQEDEPAVTPEPEPDGTGREAEDPGGGIQEAAPDELGRPRPLSDWSSWRSPAVLALAEECAIDLDEVSGTGYWGRIRKVDVIAHLKRSGLRQSERDRSLVDAARDDSLPGGERAAGSPA